ncbi:CRISPR-associated endonuclease Cas3'', partial [candidate division WOR-3 bacterium JGI_Cruoil_03_51_56]
MFFSHPGVPLEQHLLEVGKSAEGFVNRTNLADAALLASIARIMGYCHDFGKYTTFFQEHLPPLKRNSGAKQHHSLLSAILAANEVNHLCEGMTQTDEASRYLPLLAFLAVRRHHGDLCAPNTVIPPAQALADFPKLPHIGSAQREELKALPEQIKNIRQSPDFALVVLQMRKLGVADLKAFLVVNKCLNVLRKLGKLCYQYENDQVPVQTRKRVCSWMLLLYSSLIDADKKSAAQVRQVRRAGIPPEVVGNFLKCMPQDDTPEWMQKLRQSVRRAVMEKVKQIPTSQRLLTLTAPTG